MSEQSKPRERGKGRDGDEPSKVIISVTEEALDDISVAASAYRLTIPQFVLWAAAREARKVVKAQR